MRTHAERPPTFLSFACKTCGKTYESPLPAISVQCSGVKGKNHPCRLMAARRPVRT